MATNLPETPVRSHLISKPGLERGHGALLPFEALRRLDLADGGLQLRHGRALGA